ncbi:hypothetical protein [Hansschlegelia zhihuaiae]|uniref:Uncharacterized protein n=1 Tax=Hansschlegelia zhihuaiae TaxID=405005 RepID=A0A4Q0MNR0_9HYPH|nr:hypothetical protein [Hansschlegelia zhihuaiae]RXF75551.1 hypothetical protein EK403_01480 [Hansschlegelia zhihuaiae]
MELLGVLIARETIIATAVVGAALATAASLRSVRARAGPAAAGALVKAGYALTGVSMLLMIVAGFLSGR